MSVADAVQQLAHLRMGEDAAGQQMRLLDVPDRRSQRGRDQPAGGQEAQEAPDDLGALGQRARH